MLLRRCFILLETSLILYLVFAFNGSQSSLSGELRIILTWENSNFSGVAETGNYTSCESTLNILNCYYMKAMPFPRRRVIEIRSRYVLKRKCDTKNSSSGWILSFENETVHNCSEYYDENDIIMESHTIGSGHFRMIMEMTEYDGKSFENVLSDECVLTIVTERSLPKIVVSKEIDISCSKLRSADDEESVDLNLCPKQNGSPIYELTCDVIWTPNPGFCNGSLENDAPSTVTSEYTSDSLPNEFKLYVNIGESNCRQSTSQSIRVKRGAKYTISCVGNCIPEIDVSKITTLRARCHEGCDLAGTLYWKIDIPNFDVDKDALTGTVAEELILKPNKLVFGRNYTVQFVDSGGSEVVTYNLLTHTHPKIHSCEINPKEGYAVKTKFHVKCSYNLTNMPGRNFEVYAVNEDKAFPLTSGFEVENLEFGLNANDKVKVKVFDQYHFSDSQILDVAVRSIFENVTSMKGYREVIEKVFFDKNSNQSLDDLKRYKRYDQLLQSIMVLSEELEKLKTNAGYENLRNDYNKGLLEMMQKVPLTGEFRPKQMVSLMGTVSELFDDELNQEISKLSNDICEKSSIEYQNYILRDPYSKYMIEEIREMTKAFSQCFISYSPPKTEKTDRGNGTSKPFSPQDFDQIIEDYPDYGNQQNTTKVSMKFDNAYKKIESLCYAHAKLMAATLYAGDDTERAGNENFEVTATKGLGKIISSNKITSQNVTMFISEDFQRYSDEEISVLLCTSQKNPFWWMKNEKIDTYVAMIQFIVGNREVHEFEKPFSISLWNNERNHSWVPFYVTKAPRHYWSTGICDRVHGIEDDVVLDIYVSDFVKPTLDEFKAHSTIVDETNTRTFINHENQFDSWDYLCILPNEQMGERQLIVKFRVYTISCVTWQRDNRTWVFSCGVAETTTLDRFDCICYHSSLLAGRVSASYVKEEITGIYIEHHLSLQTDIIIYVSVAVAYFLYCLILIIISLASKWDTDRKIYCLSDMARSSRNAYFIIVKTGNGFNAGTTSNVFIKLFGEDASTEEHILNSPDPEGKILQNNQEDWFFLSTKEYLGEIEELEIWFESAGLKPSWYCSEIEVVDVQKKKYWWFNIKYNFEISINEKYFITAYPEELDDEYKEHKISLNRCKLEGNHMWNIFRHEGAPFTKHKRLTILLSIFMTTYAILLAIYGFPKMENNDSLGEYMEFSFYTKSIWSTICSLLVTFLLHLPIVHFFRYPCEGKTLWRRQTRN
ncbi:hypothetical protein JTB14_003162 [Gonioctena quinquepunctata]|nr:hypothetical protein JTB14_003162 [Gonioctena quinquepunctata]